MERKLAAILAADVVGYSRMMGADEARTLNALKTFERDTIEPAVARHSGRIVKCMGDGYLIEFQSVVSAIDCALQWQASATDDIVFRIGINLGDVIVEKGDIYGDGVNIAARLEGVAEPGGICVSEDAWRYARGKVKASGHDLGALSLKNIDMPVQVFRLQADGEQARPDARPGDGGGGSTALRLRRVLLSPFRPLGANADAELLASGLSETLATALAHFEEFVLIDPGVGLRAVAAHGAIEAARRLTASYILEGTVQIAGTRVRVGAQLVDVDSGQRVWSETLDRSFENVFDLQDDITAFVASTMGDAVWDEQAKAGASKPISDLTLDDLQARGQQLLHRGDQESLAAARGIFETVRASDPDSMLPTLCLAWTHLVAVRQGWPLAREDALEYALELARGLMRRHPRSAHVHRLSSHILFTAGDHEQGLANAKRAYELNPWHADMMTCLGAAMMWTGSANDAIAHFEKAFETDPYLAGQNRRLLSLAYLLADRPADGLAVLSGNEAENSGARVHRIVNLVGLGRSGDAAVEARQLLDQAPDFTAGACPIIAAFKRAEDRDRLVSALQAAGLPA